MGYRHGVGTRLINIGNVHLDRADYANAIESLKKALREPLQQMIRPMALSNLGFAQLLDGDYEAAVKTLRDAGAEAERVGFRAVIAEAGVRLGVAMALSGETTDGMEHVKKGLALARELEAHEVIAEGLWLKAKVLAEQGKVQAAQVELKGCAEMAEEKGFHRLLRLAKEDLDRLQHA
jgi:tetratricopeptide (TPR) repeat protein